MLSRSGRWQHGSWTSGSITCDTRNADREPTGVAHMDDKEPRILDEQIAYYRARASEYDEWFLRQGRYDRGAEHSRLWFDEVATVEAALGEAAPSGDILELACGTGLWTRHLAAKAEHVTAVAASAEVIAIN